MASDDETSSAGNAAANGNGSPLVTPDSTTPANNAVANGNGNLPSTPDSPTSAGFNTDQLPFNTSQNYTDDDEASVDPEIIRDDPDDGVDEEEEEGEDLFHDNFME